MMSDRNEAGIFSHSDDEFNTIYPLRIQKLSSRHWTPIKVARLAAEFLVERKGTKVLDIGSGVGKFCFAAAISSEGHFTGIEQREALVKLSIRIAKRFSIERVNFIHANIRCIDLKNYDAFYFFNSFEENRDLSDSIDEDTQYDPSLYEANSQFLYEQFNTLPIGTRIATFHTSPNVLPVTYVEVKSEIKGTLKFWIKSY